MAATWRQTLATEGVAWFETPEQARAAAGTLGRTTPEEVLRPRATGPGWSLSDAYGYSAFPWHTDAAVALSPPRWFVLSARAISQPTRTEVLVPPARVLTAMRRSPLRVRSRNGRVRYLPAAVREPYGHRLRWDPRVATAVAPDLHGEIEALSATSTIEWRPGISAIIDNHRTLHRRPAVCADRTLIRYYVRTD